MRPMDTQSETVTLHVPFRLVKRGGRRELQLPTDTPQQHRIDNTLIKALARAFRWKRMLESGEFATIAELARHENIARSYVTRVLQLTLLAPDIVDAILEARPARVLLQSLRAEVPLDWRTHKQLLRLD